MAVQDELRPGTDAWTRLGKKGRAKERARLGKTIVADRRKKSKTVAKRNRDSKRDGSR